MPAAQKSTRHSPLKNHGFIFLILEALPRFWRFEPTLRWDQVRFFRRAVFRHTSMPRLERNAHMDQHDTPAAAVEPPRLLLHGLDSLYVSFFPALTGGVLDFGTLAEARARAAASRDRMSPLRIGDERFAILSHGKKPYSYVLTAEAGAFEMRLAERLQPACHVQFASQALWRDGAATLVARVQRWLADIGAATLRAERISRADFAFDYHLPDGADFTADHLLSRASKDSTHRHRDRVQTITAGRGDVIVRLYDKVAEIEQASGKGFFFKLWNERRDVWRVEMQVRSARLAAAGIRGFADLASLAPDLLRELAEHHTTLRRPSADANRSRWPLHPLWAALQADISRLPQLGLIRDLAGWEPGHEYRLWHQCRSLMGALKGIACTLAERDGQDAVARLPELLERLPALLIANGHYLPAIWADDIRRGMLRREFGL